MTDVNRVILVGRLTRDAELKYTASGLAVCRFSIAVNSRRKNGDTWEDRASFFDIVCFGKMGETLNQYLVKGKQVCVDGELQQNRWEQDGQPRSKVEVIAANLQLLGGTSSSSGQSGYTAPVGSGYQAQPSGGYSSAPTQSYQSRPQQNQSYQRQTSAEPYDSGEYDASDLDNIPF
ncbi:MAG: single-stranded DNA-binding protein [Spirochaetaceae bacterium]|nr:single-stranded DNA-binding protein [Spirochaetaceae bacterium]